jgi:ketosteroid isomerase-like protein
MITAWLALLCFAPSAALSQEQNPSVREVLEANVQLEKAIAAGDAEAIAAHFSPEFRLHNAANKILTAEQVLEQFRSGATRFSEYQRDVEAAYASGDVVVLMGQERVKPLSAPAAERAIVRRFTSVWRKTPGGWRQIARQATVVGSAPLPQ